MLSPATSSTVMSTSFSQISEVMWETKENMQTNLQTNLQLLVSKLHTWEAMCALNWNPP